MTNKPNNKVEEIKEKLVQDFHDNWTEYYGPKDWRRLKGRRAIDCEAWLKEKLFEALASSYEQGVRDAVGNIGAGLLAQHSPQAVLDAYFDVANKVLEKYETDN